MKNSSAQIKQFVSDQADAIHSKLLAHMHKTDLTGEQKWLVYGRIIQLLFSNHFKFSIKMADEELTDAELEILRVKLNSKTESES